MIKGFLALFTSGIIFRLPVLIGVIIGIFMMFTLSDDQIFEVFYNPLFYIFGLIVSFIYAFTIKRIYHKGGSTVDWRATTYSIIGHFVSYVAAVIFSCLFIFTISFGGFDNNNDDADYDIDNAQAQELLRRLQKEM